LVLVLVVVVSMFVSSMAIEASSGDINVIAAGLCCGCSSACFGAIAAAAVLGVSIVGRERAGTIPVSSMATDNNLSDDCVDCCGGSCSNTLGFVSSIDIKSIDVSVSVSVSVSGVGGVAGEREGGIGVATRFCCLCCFCLDSAVGTRLCTHANTNKSQYNKDRERVCACMCVCVVCLTLVPDKWRSQHIIKPNRPQINSR